MEAKKQWIAPEINMIEINAGAVTGGDGSSQDSAV